MMGRKRVTERCIKPKLTLPKEVRIGREMSPNTYCKTRPREWTEDEIRFLQDAIGKGYTKQEVAEAMGRSAISVSVKVKRLGKRQNTYNAEHVDDKYETNRRFCEMIQPRSVLDVYCGERSWWKNNATEAKVVTNDKDGAIEADWHLDALKMMCKEYLGGGKYDIVDLDPFGSCYDCIDLGVKMAKKAIIVTFGEMGHKRFKRLDYVRRYYGIGQMDEFTVERLIDEVIRIGERNKKRLTPVFVKEWRLIARAYFTIEPIKITEQWD